MTPICRVVAGSIDVTSKVTRQLMSIEITDEIGVKSDKLTIKLADHESRNQIPPPKTPIAPFLGYRERGLWPLGLFVVEQVTTSGWSPQVMTINCIAADMTSEIKNARSKSYNGYTIGGIVDEIAGRHGAESCVTPELRDKLIEHIDQTDESDMNFLSRLAKDKNALFKPSNGKLIFKVRGDGKTCTGAPIPPVIITKADMMNPSFTFKEREKADKTKAHHQDRGKASREGAEGTGTKDGGTTYLRGTFPTKAEAEDAAAAKAKEAVRLEKSGSFDVVGRPDIFAGAPVLIVGCRIGWDGLWTIKTARHKFTTSGYLISVTIEPPTDMEDNEETAA